MTLNTKSTLEEIITYNPDITVRKLNNHFTEVAFRGVPRGLYRVETSDRTYHVARRYFGDPNRNTLVGDFALEAIQWLVPAIVEIETGYTDDLGPDAFAD